MVRAYGGALKPGDCAGSDVQTYFKDLPDTIAGYGWNRANFHFVGYYECDCNLTAGPHGYDWLTGVPGPHRTANASGWSC